MTSIYAKVRATDHPDKNNFWHTGDSEHLCDNVPLRSTEVLHSYWANRNHSSGRRHLLHNSKIPVLAGEGRCNKFFESPRNLQGIKESRVCCLFVCLFLN